MANPKYHWAVSVPDPSKCRNAWKAHTGGYYARACGRRYANAAFPDSAADFVNRAKRDPDWHCLDCAKAARLALAAESAPNPDAVVWPKPRPISEARETEILGYCPDIGWRRLSQMGRKWALTGAEYIADYEPSHFLPLPPEVR
jgi:hypothetical protein